ncbi:MAG TPA: hypothetical protein VFM46_12380, partial [Pseudomonadales bacterium]|nr:hypothetical protein [Pseudomonadales bacterium]
NQLLALAMILAALNWLNHTPRFKKSVSVTFFLLCLPKAYGFYAPTLYFTLKSWPDWEQEVTAWRTNTNRALKIAPNDNFAIRLSASPLKLKRSDLTKSH